MMHLYACAYATAYAYILWKMFLVLMFVGLSSCIENDVEISGFISFWHFDTVSLLIINDRK